MNCRAFGPVALALGALALSACGRQSSKPDAEIATGDQPRDHFVVVTGCLRPGVTDNTFVLTTAKTEGDAATATYELLDKPGVMLRDHQGQQVEISGTELSENIVASSGRVVEHPAKGTTGTPVVETRTNLDIKKLDVTGVKPTGIKCPE